MDQNPGIFDNKPVFALGFRPFYLLGALFAAVAIPAWLLVFARGGSISTYLQGAAWHSHEMIFGFAAAVIAGFLLTAVRNWTGRPTPVGTALAALAALWLLARILIVTGPAVLAALVDVLFLPALAIAVAIPIWRSRNVRNYKVLALLAGLTVANVVYQLTSLGYLPPGLAAMSVVVALDLIAILFAIVGGRVIPAFIRNAVQGSTPRYVPFIEYLAFGLLIAILLLDVAGAVMRVPSTVWVLVLGAGALAHAARLAFFAPLRAWGNPLLLMLPAAYAWLPVTLLARALAEGGLIPASAATHTLTVGAIASLMMAMMTRSSLGHSGRALVAGQSEIWAFLLLQFAAALRLLGASVASGYYFELLVASGVFWTAAFVVFLLRYLPILVRPRIDGRPG